LNENTNFFEKVYDVCRQIPAGRISSYGAVAKYISMPGAARMVGWALNKCESANEYVPAHRIVNRMGLLTGKQHFSGVNLMQELLENEGVTIINNQIIDFDKIFWDPNKELK